MKKRARRAVRVTVQTPDSVQLPKISSASGILPCPSSLDRAVAVLCANDIGSRLSTCADVLNAIYQRAASARASGGARAFAPAARPPQAPATPEIQQETDSLALFFQRSTERPAQLQRETALADANARLREDLARLRTQAAAAERALDEERDAALKQEAVQHAELARLHERVAEEVKRNAELQAEVRARRSSAEERVERGLREPQGTPGASL
ncbi:hypothetical protein PsYK624_154340 [Phanerochaete sordida]|uniref:Uncharacterized protein n=1 Tax=Phanerochaete sordida TaxID=48140 RepID=A0A9P3GQ94_9APHY|nr:hypothetical protein PsYK624_154340 [Phanerochaete sordida]